MKLRICFISVISLLLSLSTVQVGYAGTPDWSDLEWSPDGKMLVAVGIRVTIFDEDLAIIASTNRPNLFTPSPQWYYERSVRWSPDGKQFATIQDERSVENKCALTVWDAIKLEITYQFPDCTFGLFDWIKNDIYVERSCTEIAVYSTETFDIAKNILLNDIETDQPCYSLDGQIEDDSLKYQETFGSFTENNYQAYIYRVDLTTQELIWKSLIPFRINASAIFEKFIAIADAKHIGIFDLNTGNSIKIIDKLAPDNVNQDEYWGVREIAWSDNGRYLAIGTNLGLEIWDVTDGKLVQTLWKDSNILALDWQPSGTKLAVAIYGSGHNDGDYVQIFDMEGQFTDE